MPNLSETMQAALDSFAAQGVKITKEMRQAVVAQQQNEMREAAETVLSRKLVSSPATATVAEWAENMFTLADSIASDVTAEERNVQGRGLGTKTVRAFTIETPHGRLTVNLSERD